MLYQKKGGNLVAMTTPVVRQLVNNSGLALSCLIFVFLSLRLYKRVRFWFKNSTTILGLFSTKKSELFHDLRLRFIFLSLILLLLFLFSWISAAVQLDIVKL